MTRTKRTLLIWSVTLSCLAWMGFVGWLLFAAMPAAVENHSSTAVKDRMATQCQGSFRDRYECKEAIIVESGRDTFFVMAGRFLAVIVPPLLLSGWLSSYLRKNPIRFEAAKVEVSDEWKAKARKHTAVYNRANLYSKPASQTSAMNPDENPDILPDDDEEPEPEAPRSFTLDDIAPVEDWRTRANKKFQRPQD